MSVSFLFLFISFFLPSLHLSRELAFPLSVLLGLGDPGLVGILEVYHLLEKESYIPLLEMQGRREGKRGGWWLLGGEGSQA